MILENQINDRKKRSGKSEKVMEHYFNKSWILKNYGNLKFLLNLDSGNAGDLFTQTDRILVHPNLGHPVHVFL